MKNEKGIALTMPSKTNLTSSITMTNHKPTRSKFQYHCSFCACELADDGLRFNGVGACTACGDLAHLWVNSLREHAAHYFNNLGVKR